jgi:hypothetical protein
MDKMKMRIVDMRSFTDYLKASVLNLYIYIYMKQTIERRKTMRSLSRGQLTSVISFNAVSQPNENSVPGTLLLIVAGIMAMGIRNSGN